MRRAHLLQRTLAGALIVTLPGCLLGSPLAAISGEPYGMVIDDVKALSGKNGRIWSKAPFFAAIDLPIAFCLDTALLPLSLPIWGIMALIGDEEEDRGSRRDRLEREDDDNRTRRDRARPDRTGAKDRASDSRATRE
jgi:uncharacterized protein YceK